MEKKLSRIEIITSLTKFQSLKAALGEMGATGMTVMQVLGCGVQRGAHEYDNHQKLELDLIPKQLIVIVVETELAPKVIKMVKEELYTGHIGDGKIFVSDITNVVRVRTGEEGYYALIHKDI